MAISIPIFTAQLEKSRDAVTESNVRAAYAEAQAAWLTGDSDTANGVTVSKTNDAGTVVVTGVKIMGQRANGAFQTWPFSFKAGNGAAAALDNQTDHNGTTLTFTYTADNAQPTLTVGASSPSDDKKPGD
ncbi:hypothetical protein ACTQ1N_11855 [Porcincola sp. LCP21S3_C12]|uniref:hypothetical protein n=1 Tax=Lachnospiraceae TaxID=186803 RepID=UPI003F997E0B